MVFKKQDLRQIINKKYKIKKTESRMQKAETGWKSSGLKKKVDEKRQMKNKK